VTRIVLAFFVSGLVLATALVAAWVQSNNFRRAARLDDLQLESQWYLRRISLLREDLERSAFEAQNDFAMTHCPSGGEQ
jgi:hypothetical protein